MYKKIKDEKLQKIKDQNIHSALSKIEGATDTGLDED